MCLNFLYLLSSSFGRRQDEAIFKSMAADRGRMEFIGIHPHGLGEAIAANGADTSRSEPIGVNPGPLEAAPRCLTDTRTGRSYRARAIAGERVRVTDWEQRMDPGHRATDGWTGSFQDQTHIH